MFLPHLTHFPLTLLRGKTQLLKPLTSFPPQLWASPSVTINKIERHCVLKPLPQCVFLVKDFFLQLAEGSGSWRTAFLPHPTNTVPHTETAEGSGIKTIGIAPYMIDGEKKIAAIPDRMPEKMTGMDQGTRGTQTSIVHNTKGEKYFHGLNFFFRPPQTCCFSATTCLACSCYATTLT